jgi:hypothetical protein
MTAAIATTTPPPVRLRSAPTFEPPYDDETAPTPAGQAHRAGPLDVELPLDWGRRDHRLSDRPGPRRAGQIRHRGGAGHPQTAGQQIPDELRMMIRRFADLYVEVLNVRRPLRHLRPMMTEEAFETTRSALTRRGTTWWPVPVGRLPARTADRITVTRLPGRPMVIAVRRLRCCRPVPGVAEVAAVLHRGDEVRAVGFRLEQDDLGWLCTALEFVG